MQEAAADDEESPQESSPSEESEREGRAAASEERDQGNGAGSGSADEKDAPEQDQDSETTSGSCTPACCYTVSCSSAAECHPCCISLVLAPAVLLLGLMSQLVRDASMQFGGTHNSPGGTWMHELCDADMHGFFQHGASQ